jgi:ElaB/YqjD/DUF883 family membrane-anchored ribosome-binding protein
MSTEPEQPTATEDGEQRSPEQIRSEIDQTREEMGDTVEQLAAKTDVKGQARQRVDEAKARVRDKRDELTSKAKETTPQSAQQGGQQIVAKVRENPAPVALGGALVAGFVLGRLTSR